MELSEAFKIVLELAEDNKIEDHDLYLEGEPERQEEALRLVKLFAVDNGVEL